MVLVATMFIVSQATAYSIDTIGDLWKASALLGLAYGGLFGLFPTLVIEWFGLRRCFSLISHPAVADAFAAHFSENWGFVSLSPMLGGNVFSIAFGRNLDAHSEDDASPGGPVANATLSALSAAVEARAGGAPDAHHCAAGRACYVDSLQLTIAACCVALGLAVYAGWRDLRRQRRAAGAGGPAVVIWESDD